jgi:4-hydroxybenzoate polyprenyltransferase
MTSPRGLLELTRASLALSPLADQLAGAALANAIQGTADFHALPLSLVTSLSAFIFGMAGNDLCDREVDRARGNRPIPAGRVSLRSSRIVVGVSASIALLASATLSPTAFFITCAMLGLIALYNSTPAHLGMCGPIVLGAIRGLNLSLGAALVFPSCWRVAALYAVCIAAIAFVGRMEDGAIRPTRGGVITCVAIAALALASTPLVTAATLGAPHSGVAWIVVAAGCGWLISKLATLLSTAVAPGPALARFVGAALATIFFFDASIAAAADDHVICVIVLLMFPCARALVRAFPPS